MGHLCASKVAPFLRGILADMKSRTALIISIAAVVFMCAVIFTFSAMPADDSNRLSTGLIWHIVGFIVPGYDQMSAAEQLQWQEALQFPVRKAAHFSEYALLGMLMLNMTLRLDCLRDRPISVRAGVAWALCVAYCLTDEIHQIFVPGRTFKLLDIVIDSSGALAGIALVLLIMWIVKRVRRSRAQHA